MSGMWESIMIKVFDYKCEFCKNTTEVFESKQKERTCERCGGKMHRQLSYPGMIKGNCVDGTRFR